MTRNIIEYKGQAWEIHDQEAWTALRLQNPTMTPPQDARFIVRSQRGVRTNLKLHRFLALQRQPVGDAWPTFTVLHGFAAHPAHRAPEYPKHAKRGGWYAVATRVSRKLLPQNTAGIVTGRVSFKHPQFDQVPRHFGMSFAEQYLVTDFSALERYCLRDVLSSRPPLGLKPRKLHDQHRQDQIEEAIERYMRDDKPLPLEWVEEYNELVKRYAS